jgi:outer membrane protein TolC
VSTGRAGAENDTLSSILLHAALEDRNSSAAKALDAYYQLGAAEANRDIVRQAQAVTDRALTQARDLKRQGLAVAIDDALLYRQKLDIRSQSAKLELLIEKLNSDLRLEMGFAPPGPAWRFWPQDAPRLNTEPVQRDEAVAVGLSNRPELQLLTELEDRLNSENAPAVLQAMQAVNALLGKGKPPLICPKLQLLLAMLCGPGDEAELQIRRKQLRELHVQKEHEVIEQIGQAVQAIHAQKEVIGLVGQQIASWQTKIRESEDKEQRGVGSFAETAAARTEWLQVKRRAVEEVATLQRAWVKLRQTQGMLVAGCPPGMRDCYTGSGFWNGQDTPARSQNVKVARELGVGPPSPAVPK